MLVIYPVRQEHRRATQH